MKTSARGAAPAACEASRGDLFRELFEKDLAAATAAQPDVQHATPVRDRADIYGRLYWSRIFSAKKKLKGPIDGLTRRVGSNRCAEFGEWLRRLRGVTGASMRVRYASLLAIVRSDIDEAAIDFRYTDEMYGTFVDPTKEVRTRLEQAFHDVAELQPLFNDMQMLYYRLDSAKRRAAIPLAPVATPAAPNADEMRQAQERAASAARSERIKKSREFLRELTRSEQCEATDVRFGNCWITLAAIVDMFADDLRGFGDLKPLWPSTPTVDQLAQDYRIRKRDAARILAAHRVAIGRVDAHGVHP